MVPGVSSLASPPDVTQSNSFNGSQITSLISCIYERVINNPCFWAISLVAASAFAIPFAAVTLPANTAAAVSIAVTGVLSVSFCVLSTEIKKWLFSELSLFNTSVAGLIPACICTHPWYTEITPHITLGAAPLKSRDHFQQIQSTHHAVLSLIEEYEHLPHMMGVPVIAEDWHRAGISFLHLPNPDLTAVKLDDVKRGVDWMHQQILQNKKVYIHCLAGVGRSATLVICYLIKYGHYSPQAAVQFVASKRKIAVHANSPAIHAFVSDLHRVC